MSHDQSSTPRSRSPFAWRALTSVLLAAASVILVASGVMLFVSPPGRVANWSDWRLLGLTKHDWTGLHVSFSAVFLVVAVFHLSFNLRPLLNYFKDRVTRRVSVRWEWAVALLLCGLVFAGTRAGWPPFATLLSFNERVKRSWEDPRAGAPIPHAELLTLKELSEQAKVPYETAVDRLAARGYLGVRPEVVVAVLAATNGITPQQVFAIIQAQPGRGPGAGHTGGGEGSVTGRGGPGGFGGFGGGGGGGGFGGGHGAGAGRKTLSQFCADEQLDLDQTLARLKTRGIKASADQTLRDIAAANGFERPFELLETLRSKGSTSTNAAPSSNLPGGAGR